MAIKQKIGGGERERGKEKEGRGKKGPCGSPVYPLNEAWCYHPL